MVHRVVDPSGLGTRHDRIGTAGRGSVTFAEVPMKRILRSHVEQWVKAMSLPANSRKAGLAGSTIRTRYNYVHMVFGAAVRDRIIREDPSAGVSLPKVRRA